MIDPRGRSVIEWCDLTALPLAAYLIVPRLLDETLWKNWALAVIGNAAIAALSPPDPGSFEDWREWALRFNAAVPL